MFFRNIFFLLFFSVQLSFSSCINANEYNVNPKIMNKETNLDTIVFGAGCFWGVEKKFWDLDGVYLTSVGYSGGETENPTYEDVCYKNTNHAEVVKVIYDPNIIKLNKILKVFWECHDPTQGMRQGNDIGTQYRSVIYSSDPSDLDIANESKEIYQKY